MINLPTLGIIALSLIHALYIAVHYALGYIPANNTNDAQYTDK